MPVNWDAESERVEAAEAALVKKRESMAHALFDAYYAGNEAVIEHLDEELLCFYDNDVKRILGRIRKGQDVDGTLHCLLEDVTDEVVEGASEIALERLGRML